MRILLILLVLFWFNCKGQDSCNYYEAAQEANYNSFITLSVGTVIGAAAYVFLETATIGCFFAVVFVFQRISYRININKYNEISGKFREREGSG